MLIKVCWVRKKAAKNIRRATFIALANTKLLCVFFHICGILPFIAWPVLSFRLTDAGIKDSQMEARVYYPQKESLS